MRKTFADVQRNVSEIANRQIYTSDVLYELMAAYGRSASSITKLRNGVINLADDPNHSVLQRGVVYFREVLKAASLPAEVENLEMDPLTTRYNPRFLIVTDLTSFAAKDTKKGNTLELKWENIDRNVDFFYGWTGDEVVDEKTEAAADRRAADKMKELYSEVEKVNIEHLTEKNSNFRHELNVFFTRLLFCFFAEDTRVFTKDGSNIFTSSIKDFTQTDGSDLDQFLGTLFESLDTKDKSEYTSPFSNFPYVNGSLFDKKKGITIPKFNAQARKLILDCGALSWAEINPDIFGSMFQSIVDEALRETHGMHYTSVPNIMKTIEPLFLDELRNEFDKYFNNKDKLGKLHERISKIKIFDPACGSGNFLIIAYKELRKLEHAIIDRVFEKDYERAAMAGKLTSRIDLNNFYGIEIDDFACEVAVLSLYIAKHQMNIEFEKQFGRRIELIPLEDKANIVKANAARIDWQDVCPNKPHSIGESTFKQVKLIADEFEQKELIDIEHNKKIWDEIYLISNPPYQGARKQSADQKRDMSVIFEGVIDRFNDLDYISIWFCKGVIYIKDSLAKLAFVSTNSITQGQQVSFLWPIIFNNDEEINFAHLSFKWENNAGGNAGVTVIIISIRNKSKEPKYLFDGIVRLNCRNISPYLIDSDQNTIVNPRNKNLSGLPPMDFGSMPNDGGNFILTVEEKAYLENKYPNAKKFIKSFIGAEEFINGISRYCLWITDTNIHEAKVIDEIKKRIDNVREKRNKSIRGATNKLANYPHRFGEIRYKVTDSIIVPRVSSERREYIIAGYLNKNTIISDAANAIYDAELWVFSILVSRMHMVWVKTVAGRLKTDIRYSTDIVYNTFPTPSVSVEQKEALARRAKEIIFAREMHTEITLAEMYDPDKMPEDLRGAHHQNDILVDRLYRQKPYENDEERLADLFALYEKMISEEKKK
ncbi:MAG: hypothetical protein RI947_592 [Candidatus Parcubacteria bacterium]|jgi:type II restriction/modification system DNA methylase subunit YeeA